MLNRLVPCKLERWYSRYGLAARYNLSGSAAPSLTATDLLRLGGPSALDDYLKLDLNYTPQQGTTRLRQAIALQYATLDIDDIQVTTGASEAIFLLLNALIQPGDAVIVQFPIYPVLYGLAHMVGAEVRQWPLAPEGRVDLDHLSALLAQGNVRMVAINHPHSPTGMLLNADELNAIVALTAHYGATLIVDEVYRGIQFSGAVLPPAADLGPHVVSIGDLAKPYGLGGLRVGWLATADGALRRRCAGLRDYTSLCGSAPGELLGSIALEHRDTILEQHLATARRNRTCFTTTMNTVQWLDWELGHGGFTIFPRTTSRQSTDVLCQELRERHEVLLLPGEVYDKPGYLRLGFGVEPTHFDAGLERLLAYRPA